MEISILLPFIINANAQTKWNYQGEYSRDTKKCEDIDHTDSKSYMVEKQADSSTAWMRKRYRVPT